MNKKKIQSNAEQAEETRGTQLRMGISQCSIWGKDSWLLFLVLFLTTIHISMGPFVCTIFLLERVIKEISTKQGACPRIHEI